MSRRERGTWEEWWAGRGLRQHEDDKPPVARTTATVHEAPDDVLLYVEDRGERYVLWRKERAGFVR